MPRILVLVAHPDLGQSRATRRLAEAALRAGPDLAVRDLYALYPDYLVDAEAERAALRGVQLLVWLHPWHWYGMTPLLKLWLDEVLAFGWAYGPGGQALAGTDLWLVTSTGGAAQAYRAGGHSGHAFEAFLPPYTQTAALCGMRFVPPLVLHGAHQADDAALAQHADRFAQRLRRYPDWPDCDGRAGEPPCDVPAQARPQAGGPR